MFSKCQITIGKFFDKVCYRIPCCNEGVDLLFSLEKKTRRYFEGVLPCGHKVGVIPTDGWRCRVLKLLNGKGVEVFV